MSLAARIALVDRLQFNDRAGKADLLDIRATSTYLIQLLEYEVAFCPHPILITMVKTGHHDDSALGKWSHWGNGTGGGSVDLWNGDWMTVGDAKVRDVIDSLLANPYCWTLGLAGYAQQFFDYARSKRKDDRQIIFLDDGADHLHAQCGNAYGFGRRQ